LEASTANLIAYRAEAGIISPPQAKILPGVSLSTAADLAADLGIPMHYRDLSVQDLLSSEEVMLCSTSPCIWPVTAVDRQMIGQGQRGPICDRLLAAWSKHVGLDILAQAEQFASRR
jgi:branched-subunit amino acid aminotransferase/4-amino-4-deoxychorismate lyase